MMLFLIKNTFTALRISLTVLTITGFWTRKKESTFILRYGYAFCNFMFIIGISILTQTVELLLVFGDVALMTDTSFLLFTNVALGLKMFNMVSRREQIRALIEESEEELQGVDTCWGIGIIKTCVRQSTMFFAVFTSLPSVAAYGIVMGCEKGELPLRAWYPYNITATPAGFKIIYMHQVISIITSAIVNVSLDTAAIGSIAQLCCRLRLLSASLRMLGVGIEQDMLNQEQEAVIRTSIENCVRQHQSVLEAAGLVQEYFSSSIFLQIIVSTTIICVSAYQMAFASNATFIFGMAAYFICLTIQAFLYCYQGHELSEESVMVGQAVYESRWYKMSAPLRKDLMLMMLRSQRVAKITAAGFTTLSLNAFMSIIKTSYTLFTVLQGDK